MLSIEGTSFGEVFGGVAARPELDASERGAAAAIGAWISEWERVEWELIAAANSTAAGSERAWRNADARQTELLQSRPFISGGTDDGRGKWFSLDGITFVVLPHTAGATMNVGVERAS